MSETVESPPSKSPVPSPPSPEVVQLHDNPDLGSDILLWRRKQLNVIILLVATATWIVMEVYQYNFVTVFSWVAMALVLCLFFWGNIHRLFKKEGPDLSEVEIREETAMEYAKLFRQRTEDGLRLMLHVSCEREWFVFAGVVACLYVIAEAAAHVDFLTICYIGVVGGMTIPIIYVKNERKIKDFGEKSRMKSQRLYDAIMGNKLQKMKNKVAGKSKEIEEKQQE